MYKFETKTALSDIILSFAVLKLSSSDIESKPYNRKETKICSVINMEKICVDNSSKTMILTFKNGENKNMDRITSSKWTENNKRVMATTILQINITLITPAKKLGWNEYKN